MGLAFFAALLAAGGQTCIAFRESSAAPPPSPKVGLICELDDEQSRRLWELARELHVDPSELAKAAIHDLVSRPSDDFERAAQRVLEKNRELYRRLS